MLSIIKKFKFNKYLALLNQKYLISTGENVGEINIINQQHRTLTTTNDSVSISARTATSLKNDMHEFMAVLPDFLRDLTEMPNKYSSKEASEWLAGVLKYNLPGGRKMRGLLTVSTYKLLADKNELTFANILLAKYLGWCLELLHSGTIIMDDVIAESSMRRGQLCWHKLEHVGFVAINDFLLIEYSIYYLLQKYFKEKPYYTALLEHFHEHLFTLTVGESLDIQTSKKNVTDFTMEQYKAIVANKSAPTLHIPIVAAMHMARFTDPDALREIKTISYEIGELFQIQDDFLDCFGDPTVTGKLGSDIQYNKCSWPAVVYMERANEQQKNIMKECYGKKETEKVATVKKLYKELDLPAIYAAHENDSYNHIKTHIKQASKTVPPDIFDVLLNKVFQRSS